ncbi:2-amino-4-hydroxy-6-hydroxymethyldihydropteridine diphosphokinase [uncultured Endozoicomonas sp.]|uniref:2-amino-4-hydroxy-6- hydroxymethyldihydropteridine diphosphokinase n=1 Tax=uncultured Endozoicomonas sp. TaxID=432652 RepID=UPI00262AF84F|nr:2-amino-4-hydroxy-6-hydroxymethyldihydropteridine diphosphokinase [uncultured Endozoicomonas sp.]
MRTRAYIALGSNLEQPELQLQRAVDEIDSLPCITLAGCSKLYQSDPVGPPGQPDYCNAVIAVDTTLTPIALLDAMQSVENDHGRVRSERWGPRTLDLDILLYGNEVVESERLTIPHYQMHLRNFVLLPLMDIAPELVLPNGRSIKMLAAKTDDVGLSIIAGSYPWQ